MKLAIALLQALKDYGAKEIFGIPGDFALPFFREIETSQILPLYTLSHEPAVGFAADCSGRFNGTLAVAAVTYGAGGLNIINPIAAAYAEKSPLVIISGAPGAGERNMGLGLHHQVKHFDSQLMIMKEVTCAQCVLDDPIKAPDEIARVLHAARKFSRPVYIEFPRDMVAAETSNVPPYSPYKGDAQATEAAATEIISRLNKAKKPALLIGVEVRRFGLECEVAALANKLKIPVVTSFMGRGLLAETDTPVAGTYIGLAGEPSIRQTVEGSDALLMLGVIMCDTNFGVSEREIDMRNAVHAIDGTVRINHAVYSDIDLAGLVQQLLEKAEDLNASYQPPQCVSDTEIDENAQILPAGVAQTVNTFFERYGNMPIASDMGDCFFTAMDIHHTALVAPAYYATMGTGIPFGIGLQVASGKRPLVLVGDGAFQMTGWELGNCRRYGLNPIVLLFNNTAWGMLKAFQKDASYNDLEDWNFTDFAKSTGGIGIRVTTPKELMIALEAAHKDESTFHLIEIMLPQDAMSTVLRRFTETIAKRSALAKEIE